MTMIDGSKDAPLEAFFGLKINSKEITIFIHLKDPF